MTTRAPRSRLPVMAGVAVGALLLHQVPMSIYEPDRMAAVFLATWAMCLIALAVSRPGVLRPSTVYLGVFGLFHGGLLVAIAARGPELLADHEVLWAFDPHVVVAVRLVLLGMVCFTLGALSVGREAVPQSNTTTRLAPPGMGAWGLALEIAGALIFFSKVATAGGWGLVSGGYASYIETNSTSGLVGYATLGIGMGAVLAVLGGGRERTAAWVVFVLYAVVAFPLGVRGSVLFPFALLMVAEARCGRRLRPLPAAAGAWTVLTAIGIIRQGRVDGYSWPGLGQILAAPLDAIAEMGSTLRPVAVVTDWHSGGDPYREGITLVVGPLRVLERLTGWNGGQPAHDDRFFNVEIADRVGPIGGSPIAEGYHNFGTVGVILLMAAIGLFVGWIDRRPTPLADLRLILLLPLLIQVRNSFAPVPAWLLVAVALIALVRLRATAAASDPHLCDVGRNRAPASTAF